MKYIFFTLMIFLAGVVAAINLTDLIPTNPNYEASWFKFTTAVFLGICFSCAAKENPVK